MAKCVMCVKRHPLNPSMQREAKKSFPIDNIKILLCPGCALEIADWAELLHRFSAGRPEDVQSKSA